MFYRHLDKLENGDKTAIIAVYTSNSVQIYFLRLFAPYEKSLGPKIKTLALSETKFYRRFNHGLLFGH